MKTQRKSLATALIVALGLAVGACSSTFSEPGGVPQYPGLKGFGSSAGATSGASGGGA